MGGNIPSRSFKILQAMTMPENAGESLIFIMINTEYNNKFRKKTKLFE